MEKAPKSLARKTDWPGRLPLLFVILGFLICDCIAVHYMFIQRTMWMRTMSLDAAMFCSILGQFLLVAMIGGLLGRSWIAGWLWTVALNSIFVAMYSWAESRNTVESSGRVGSVLGFMPLVALGGCAPLIGMRAMRGWSLSRRSDVEREPNDTRTEDLFCFSIVGACCLALANLLNYQQQRAEQFAIAGVLAVLTAVVMLPTAYVTFRSRSWRKRLLGYLALTVIAAIVCISLLLIFNYRDFSASIKDLVVGLLAAALTIALGGSLLWAMGYRLTVARKVSSAETETAEVNPLDADDMAPKSMPLNQAARTESRALTLAIVVVSLACVMGKWYYDRCQLQFLAEIREPAKYFDAKVDRIDLFNERVRAVVMSPEATAEDVKQVARRAPRIAMLSLADMQISDEVLDALSQFRSLTELDLSRTNVTSACLSRVPDKLRILRLADTKVEFAAVLQRVKSLHELDLSGTGIDDEALRTLPDSEFTVFKLSLARNPITDAGVTNFFEGQGPQCYALDLSDTQVTGASLLHLRCPSALKLDGTKITDQQLVALVTTTKLAWNCTDLSLRRTGITGAVLPTLATRGISLAVGQGAITEADFDGLLGVKFDRLGLNGPEFTGRCLLNGSVKAGQVSLSHSSINDDLLMQLAQSNPGIYAMNLSHTNITEKSLRLLNCSQLDVTNTQVNASSIVKSPLSIWQLFLRHEAFTPEEILKLRGARVLLDSSMSSYPW